MSQERRGAADGQHVLVIDDEPDIRELLELTLSRMGLEVTCVGGVESAREALKARRFALCLTDMRLPDGNGLDVVRVATGAQRELPVAVITAYGSTENAVAALKAGAFDYVSKPVGLEQLRALVRAALALPVPATERDAASDLLGDATPIANVRHMIARLARTQAPVHITGESGSGKELAARLIHAGGARRERPFVAVNCGAIPETLMESEFFGYRRGAFTGADSDRDGFFQAAHGGTLFLDEVAELPLGMQVKLLRAIQEKRARRVGATQEDPVDVRILSATHHELDARVARGQFRQDLYYRLNVIELEMPPLRECRPDIPVFAEAVLRRLAAPDEPPKLTPGALARLLEHPFPGNFRELENVLERALALTSGEAIGVDDLGLPEAGVLDTGDRVVSGEGVTRLPDYLDRVEREAIADALARTGFNRTEAARRLGITFRQLRYRIQRLGIRAPDGGSVERDGPG